MKVTYEFDLSEFKAWSGGADTLEKIREFDLNYPGAMEAAQQYIEECLGDEATEVEINDMLWFDDDAILDAIGYCDEDEEEEEDEDEEDEDGFESEDL